MSFAIFYDRQQVHISGGNQPEIMSEFAQIWQNAEKIVYSRTLQEVSSAKTKINHEFNPDTTRKLKESSKANITISGPNLANQTMSIGLVDECYLLVIPIILGGMGV